MRLKIRSPTRIMKSAFLLIAGMSLLTLIDIVAVEMVIRPLTENYDIPWSDLETTVFGYKILIWHLGFFPMAVGLFTLVSAAGNDWRPAIAGTLLFFTGLEDAMYYFFQLTPLPQELPWLDSSLTLGWTRFFTKSEHVTADGLVVAIIISVTISGFILALEKTGTIPKNRA
ncbi:MAG: hypothetical protein AAB885_00270 [Patescibacteria group bacterium]